MQKLKHQKNAAHNKPNKSSTKRGIDLFLRYLDDSLPAGELAELNHLLVTDQRVAREAAECLLTEDLLRRMGRAERRSRK